MEISLIFFKDRLVSSFFIFNLISTFSISLKKEAIEYLNDLAIEFRRNSKSQISNTIKRAIQENFDLQNESAKKYFTTENVKEFVDR